MVRAPVRLDFGELRGVSSTTDGPYDDPRNSERLDASQTMRPLQLVANILDSSWSLYYTVHSRRQAFARVKNPGFSPIETKR